MNPRCNQTGPRGQCSHMTVDGSDFCARHCNEEDRIDGYRLTDPDLQARFDHHAGSSSLETVRQEIVLLRTIVEDRLSLARTEADRIVAFQAVHPALSNLSKMVETLGKLERQTDAVLEKSAIEELGCQIVDILAEELCNLDGADDIIDRVASRIATCIMEARN